MYFSLAEASPDAFGRERNWELAANGYRAHELVWSLFSDREDRKRDFLFRWETEDRKLPRLYALSKREPEDQDGNFKLLKTKPYSPVLRKGQQFGFSLRANPVVKRRDEKGRQVVHDVVMEAKHKLRESGEWEENPRTQAELVRQAGLAWLSSRAEQYGFSFKEEEVLTESYERHHFRKSKGGRPVVIATIDYKGRFQVEDVERFRVALEQGVGPSKAFGCGLLMIRPL